EWEGEEEEERSGAMDSADDDNRGKRHSKAKSKAKAKDANRTKGATGSSWKDKESSLGLCLGRLRSLLSLVDAKGRVDVSPLLELTKSAVLTRCDIDQVVPDVLEKASSPSQKRLRLDLTRKVVEEGAGLMYTTFLWRLRPILTRLKEGNR
ncbi:unnamed protein product, partial [Discosporangium mesarthrocarpum]